MTDILSAVYATTAPAWLGVYLHDPVSPATTEGGFLYGNIGRKEDLSIDQTVLRMIGRTRPIIEYGESELSTLALKTMIPFDSGHTAAVQWWRDRIRARSTLCYRDSRGRLAYVSLGKVTITDSRAGSDILAVVTECDYSEAV